MGQELMDDADLPCAATWRIVVEADQVTVEVLTLAEKVVDLWFAHDGETVPGWHWPVSLWADLFDQIQGRELEDGSVIDLGEDLNSPAFTAIKDHVLAHRRRLKQEKEAVKWEHH